MKYLLAAGLITYICSLCISFVDRHKMKMDLTKKEKGFCYIGIFLLSYTCILFCSAKILCVPYLIMLASASVIDAKKRIVYVNFAMIPSDIALIGCIMRYRSIIEKFDYRNLMLLTCCCLLVLFQSFMLHGLGIGDLFIIASVIPYFAYCAPGMTGSIFLGYLIISYLVFLVAAVIQRIIMRSKSEKQKPFVPYLGLGFVIMSVLI